MKVPSIITRLGEKIHLVDPAQPAAPPVLREPQRFPYGPFQFSVALPQGAAYRIEASTDLRHWAALSRGTAPAEALTYVDSEAYKTNCRFYRLYVGELRSANIIGYANVTLPPGFSLISNPFEHSHSVAELFKKWPDGTTLSRFAPLLFRLTDNGVKNGRWTNPAEKLAPGDGAIFYNPTSDYRTMSFVGNVLQGSHSMPIPSGFSLHGSLWPQPGTLDQDLEFPIAEGDVIHLFDRDRQAYVEHFFKNGKWTPGAPVLSVGEAFWVAKTTPGNWKRTFLAAEQAG